MEDKDQSCRSVCSHKRTSTPTEMGPLYMVPWRISRAVQRAPGRSLLEFRFAEPDLPFCHRNDAFGFFVQQHNQQALRESGPRKPITFTHHPSKAEERKKPIERPDLSLALLRCHFRVS